MKNNNVRLRALTLNDIEKTLYWHNQEDISNLYLGHPFPVNIEMERKWYEKLLTSNIPVTVFGIEQIKSKKLIGIILFCLWIFKTTIKLNSSVGFIKEGVLRNSVFKNNEFRNELVMSILKEEFNG